MQMIRTHFTNPYKKRSMKKSRLKVMTIVGTRPEIIRLSRVISLLDQYLDHVLVHTGQNYDFELKKKGMVFEV